MSLIPGITQPIFTQPPSSGGTGSSGGTSTPPSSGGTGSSGGTSTPPSSGGTGSSGGSSTPPSSGGTGSSGGTSTPPSSGGTGSSGSTSSSPSTGGSASPPSAGQTASQPATSETYSPSDVAYNARTATSAPAVAATAADRAAAIRLQAGPSVTATSIVDLFKSQDTSDRKLSTTADLLADTQKHLQTIQADMSKSHMDTKNGAKDTSTTMSDRLAHAHAAYADNGSNADKQAA